MADSINATQRSTGIFILEGAVLSASSFLLSSAGAVIVIVVAMKFGVDVGSGRNKSIT
jgi:hypothetical protein